MPRFQNTLRFLSLTAALALSAAPAAAVDKINVTDDDSPEAGTITKVTRDAVTLNTRVGGDREVGSNRIVSVEFDREPPGLKLARTAVRNGRTDEAVQSLSEVLAEVTDNKPLSGEVEYLIAVAKAGPAEADPSARPDAVAVLEAFTKKYQQHYRYYDVQLRLGRTQTLAGNFAEAEKAFAEVLNSPHEDHKMAARVAAADAQFAGGKAEDALQGYEAVIAMSPSTPAETSRRLSALLGRAKVEVSKKRFEAAVTTLEEIIEKTTASDTRVQAEAYLRMGDAYAAQGNAAKAAVNAYLHVHVIPSLSREASSHAEALYRLTQLLPATGRADKAAETAAILQELYPGSEWAAKLAG